jgi:hypothetical protein
MTELCTPPGQSMAFEVRLSDCPALRRWRLAITMAVRAPHSLAILPGRLVRVFQPVLQLSWARCCWPDSGLQTEVPAFDPIRGSVAVSPFVMTADVLLFVVLRNDKLYAAG